MVVSVSDPVIMMDPETPPNKSQPLSSSTPHILQTPVNPPPKLTSKTCLPRPLFHDEPETFSTKKERREGGLFRYYILTKSFKSFISTKIVYFVIKVLDLENRLLIYKTFTKFYPHWSRKTLVLKKYKYFCKIFPKKTVRILTTVFRPPPRPPAKSCPPKSRVFRHRNLLKAQAVSFNDTSDKHASVTETPLNSSVYDEKKKESYFEQAFLIERKLGAGCFGKFYLI